MPVTDLKMCIFMRRARQNATKSIMRSFLLPIFSSVFLFFSENQLNRIAGEIHQHLNRNKKKALHLIERVSNFMINNLEYRLLSFSQTGSKLSEGWLADCGHNMKCFFLFLCTCITVHTTRFSFLCLVLPLWGQRAGLQPWCEAICRHLQPQLVCEARFSLNKFRLNKQQRVFLVPSQSEAHHCSFHHRWTCRPQRLLLLPPSLSSSQSGRQHFLRPHRRCSRLSRNIQPRI